MSVKFPGKRCYVTLEWPHMSVAGGIDVGIQQLRNGEVMFQLGPEKKLLLGADIPFTLFVDIAVAGRSVC